MSRQVILSVEALDPVLTGVGRYVWELVQRIPRAPGIGRVRFLRNGEWIADPAKLLVDPSPIERARWHRILRKKTKPQRQWMERQLARASVCHGPNFFLPDIAETGIVTVHDLSVFRFPETHPAERREEFDQRFEDSLRRAAHVITVSETARKDVIDFTGIDPARVSAVYQGVGAAFRPRMAEELLPVLSRMGLIPGGYGLCVSTIEPRKRVAELVRAWRMLPAGLRVLRPLVLAGSSGWLSDSIFEEIAQGEREGWLRYIRYVEEGDLPFLYAGAALFVYPSIYEGFGLPPVEAMASGVPTVVSDASCLPEVTAGAALLAKPEDVEGFSGLLQKALLDESWRAAARDQGLEVAGRYSWDRCVRETAALYAKVR